MSTATSPTFYRELLRSELEHRLEINPHYSLRRYAELLGIAPGPLSEILNGRRSPSSTIVERILSRLELNEKQRQDFLRSLLHEKKALGKKRISKKLKSRVKTKALVSGETISFHELDRNHFRIIADWYHLALWEMIGRDDFVPKVSWISARLGISQTESKMALERLASEKLIELRDGRWRKTLARLQTKDLTKTSEAHRKRQTQILSKASMALETVPLARRHHSAITININPAKIPAFREKMQAALWKIATELESEKEGLVYEIALQVFPLELSNFKTISEKGNI
jgi:uncharacterized protein (TIGR02147 family)